MIDLIFLIEKCRKLELDLLVDKFSKKSDVTEKLTSNTDKVTHSIYELYKKGKVNPIYNLYSKTDYIHKIINYKTVSKMKGTITIGHNLYTITIIKKNDYQHIRESEETPKVTKNNQLLIISTKNSFNVLNNENDENKLYNTNNDFGIKVYKEIDNILLYSNSDA